MSKILKICRKYLFRIQNSVFEGELEDSKVIRLKKEIMENIITNEDNVILYKFKYKPKGLLVKERLGAGKQEDSVVI